MTTTAAMFIVLGALAAVNVWVHLGPRRWHVLTGPLFAAGLLVVGRAAGLSWGELGLGRGTFGKGLVWGTVAVGLVAVGYAAALAIPRSHRFFRDSRYRIGPRAALTTAAITIPLSTVVFEEVAFRSVLWGLVDVEHGLLWATAVTSVLFGLWHVLPAWDLTTTNRALTADGSSRGRLPAVLGTVVFTTAAGLVFALLRDASGSLLAPVLFHWATNGLGVLAAARVWAVSQE